MSYASFTKIVPDLIKSFPQKLLQPTGIAVLASVGIHALLGVSLPYWSLSSEKKSKPVRNVQLLQLTPTEQSRLPQLAPSPLSSIPNQLPPLSSLPSSGSSSRSSSLPSLSSKDSSLFNLPPISPLPPLGKIPSLSQSSRQPINLNKLSLRNSPPRNDLSSLKRSTGFSSPLSKTPSSQLPTPPNGELPPPPRTPWPTTDLSNLPSVQPAPLPSFDPNQSLPPSTLPTQPLPPSGFPNQPQPPSTLPKILQPGYNPNAIGLLPREGSSISMGPGAPTSPAVAPVPGQGNLTDNSSARNYDAYQRNVLNWQARNQIYSRPQELKIASNYPRKASSTTGSNSGFVDVAVKVDANGNILSDSLEVAGSSYSDGSFDDPAKATVRTHPFPKGKAEAYVVRVLFNNDNSSVLKGPTALPTPASPTGTESRTNSTNRTGTGDRTSTLKPSDSSDRTSTLKPSDTGDRTSTLKPSDKPSDTGDRTSAGKPSDLTNARRPASTETSGQAFMDGLRRGFNSTEKSRSNSTGE